MFNVGIIYYNILHLHFSKTVFFAYPHSIYFILYKTFDVYSCILFKILFDILPVKF